ncbi:MAG: hypothetical protein N2235_10310 [Fischerella sp.]|nr:hypothetical protein [Fischerella sp.]
MVEKANLRELTLARGSELINVLAVEIPEQLIPGISSKLKLAFQVLAEFELSDRGLVQYRIRPHLDGLTPKEAKTPKLTELPSVQQVFINLKIAHIESVRNCEKGLKQLLSESNQVWRNLWIAAFVL